MNTYRIERLWRDSYVAVLRSGQSVDRATWAADQAVKLFQARFPQEGEPLFK